MRIIKGISFLSAIGMAIGADPIRKELRRRRELGPQKPTPPPLDPTGAAQPKMSKRRRRRLKGKSS